jgi:hypothetical protein
MPIWVGAEESGKPASYLVHAPKRRAAVVRTDRREIHPVRCEEATDPIDVVIVTCLEERLEPFGGELRIR